jgi:hypothetical protein
MAAQRPTTTQKAPNALNVRAARLSGAAFAMGGAGLVVAGAVSILIGNPSHAYDLLPLAGPADVVSRFGQVAPVVSAAVAAVVAALVAGLLAMRRLEPLAAALELAILGLAVAVGIVGAAARVGYATDGSVLGSAVVCLMGATAVVAGGIIAVLGHE